MNKTLKILLVLTAGGLAACEDSVFPKWNIDLFFPIDFPDVAITDFTPGNLLPAVDVPFTATQNMVDVEDTTDEILSQTIDEIRAQFIFSTPSTVAGSLQMSIARNPGDLFSTDPLRAVTVTLPIAQTAGDTTEVMADVSLFQDALVLYTQSRGTIRSATGGIIAVDATDVLELTLNLTATVEFVQ